MAQSWRGFRRNIGILSACWALTSTSNMLLVSVTVLTGHMLAADKALAALPIALQWLGTAATTVPASFLMARIGRRGGFATAALTVIAGAALAVAAVYGRSFPLFCAATFMLGMGNGFTWYYRFAAAEVVTEDFKSRAISLVLAGGVIAAVLGPSLADRSKDLLAPHLFAGSFAVMAALQGIVLTLLAFVRIPRPETEALHGGRPMSEIARQPKFVVAVMGGVVAYGVMVLLMSITPLAMTLNGYDFSDATSVIQWHVLGMYVPAFFSGHLVRRFGTQPMMLAGAVLILACIVLAASGISRFHFWTALTLLGVGWNFLYVASTNLLTETYSVAERAKTQAANEFAVFLFVAAGTFASGTVLHYFDWRTVNLSVLPLVLAVTIATMWLAVRRPRPAT